MHLRFLESFLRIFLFAALLFGCASFQKKNSFVNKSAPISIPFKYVSGSFIAVPVKINDSVTKNFIFDTGIGLNLVSKSICEKLKCKITGKHTGKRMSGQGITIPTSTVGSLELAGFRFTDAPIGIFDMDALMPGEDIGGFLSLGFFEKIAITIDYEKQMLILENDASLVEILSKGVIVPVKIDKEGPAVSILMPLVLPNEQEISVEVDTGSQALILDERFMRVLGVNVNSPHVRHRNGKDETGHSYRRHFTKLEGLVHLPNAPEMFVSSIDTMFQKIIYDGLVGHNFLSQFKVTYNIPASEMIFQKAGK